MEGRIRSGCAGNFGVFFLPLPCHSSVQAQSREGRHAKLFEVSSLCHRDGLFQGALCLLPLLHGLRDTALGREKALQDVRQHK